MNVRPKYEFNHRAIDSISVGSIKDLIVGQAQVHTTSFNGNIDRLKDHVYQDELRASENQSKRMLNGIMGVWDHKPIAYLMYYPAFDQMGRFGYYGEDIYVDNQFRGSGVGLKLLSHFAKNALNDQACFLEWVTDLRNTPFRKFMAKRMQAERAPKMNFDASKVINGLPFTNGVDKKFVTRPINQDDGRFLGALGVNPQLADHSSDFPCVGFITINKDKNTPVAVTVANLRYSTFNTHWGLLLEPTVFANGIRNGQKLQAMKSLMIGVNEYTAESRGTNLEIRNINMYVSNDDKEAIRIAFKNFHLKYDTIAEDRHSKMAPHFIDKNGLKRLANMEFDHGQRSQVFSPKLDMQASLDAPVPSF